LRIFRKKWTSLWARAVHECCWSCKVKIICP